METKGKHGDTGYIANETRLIAKAAIKLINNYTTSSELMIKVKKDSINELFKAINQVERYYNKKLGYDYKENRNHNLPMYEFTVPAYNALDYFLSSCK